MGAQDRLRAQRTHVFWSRVDPEGPGLHLPKRSNDIGWDLEAAEDMIIPPGQYADVPTNVQLQLPDSIWAQILARSSTVKRGIMVDAGIIDPGYRGPLFVVVRNMRRSVGIDPNGAYHIDANIKVKQGERIAQLVFHQVCPVWTEEIEHVDENTDRGRGGFGSTGQ